MDDFFPTSSFQEHRSSCREGSVSPDLPILKVENTAQDFTTNDTPQDESYSQWGYAQDMMLSANQWIPRTVQNEEWKYAVTFNSSKAKDTEMKYSTDSHSTSDLGRCTPAGLSVYHELMDSMGNDPDAVVTPSVAGTTCDMLASNVASRSSNDTSPCGPDPVAFLKGDLKSEHSHVYNGAVGLGFTVFGQTRAPLLATPKDNSYLPNYAPNEAHASYLPPQSLSPPPMFTGIPSLLDQPLLRFAQRDRKSSIAIVLDSAVLDGRLSAVDLATLLAKCSLATFLDQRIHHVFYHKSMENVIQYRMDDANRSQCERQCMHDYLRLFDAYAKLELVTSLEKHGCDGWRENTFDQRVRCLRRIIISAKKKDPSTYFFYITDLKRCAIQTSFGDPRVNFLDYTEWLAIFD